MRAHELSEEKVMVECIYAFGGKGRGARGEPHGTCRGGIRGRDPMTEHISGWDRATEDPVGIL